MDTPHRDEDSQLLQFNNWLKGSRVQPPADMLARVRERLRNSPASIDDHIDQLLRPDPSLSDPQMAWKVRGRLATDLQQESSARAWLRWLVPLAAAAALALAFVSFQNSGPRAIQNSAPEADHLVAGPSMQEVDLDADLTQIIALASNLRDAGEVSKLESVENLAFLFE